MSFIEFRKYANKSLNILKEEKTSQYEKYVMRNFGKLQESVSIEDLCHIAKYNHMCRNNITFVKDAVYKNREFDYFIYDKTTCVGVNKDGKIVYIGDFNSINLSDGIVIH